MTGFIKHLKDHELSLIYHTNNDYSSYAIHKTQELFESGIDVRLNKFKLFFADFQIKK